MDDAGKAAGADAVERLFSAAKDGNWEEAYQAYYDLHVICDEQIEGGEEEEGEGTPGPEAKGGKKPLAAIIIGGPSKK